MTTRPTPLDPTSTPAPRPVAARLIAAIGALASGVGSTGRVKDGPAKYEYLSDVDVTAALRPALAAEEVIITGAVELISHTEGKTAKGNTQRHIIVAIDWTAIGPDGDSLPIGRTLGEAADTSDKAIGKAETHARKYLIRLLACLATGEDPDAAPLPPPVDRAPRGAERSTGAASAADPAQLRAIESTCDRLDLPTEALEAWYVATSREATWPPSATSAARLVWWLDEPGSLDVIGRWIETTGWPDSMTPVEVL